MDHMDKSDDFADVAIGLFFLAGITLFAVGLFFSVTFPTFLLTMGAAIVALTIIIARSA